ncbi:hypothetical protein KDI_53310 [Dictyobacter arantiisoli]|uniref:RHS repeat-associated core domain-containing protein n=1 Tax=Dictyobacter arantiisoli TaxID=2014874 RepID=A0A5A5TJZ9_9CHLR|nr:hypothetical protein KDI_53310 [Dictyobacter arantiisoli]
MQEALKANPYVYADNNPVNEVDPNGAFSLTDACLVDLVGLGGITSAVTGLFSFLGSSGAGGAVGIPLAAATGPGDVAIAGLAASLFIGLAVTSSIIGIIGVIEGVPTAKKDCGL